MKKSVVVLVLFSFVLLIGAFWFGSRLKKGTEAPVVSAPTSTVSVGGQKDDHGCLLGAGYSWCDAKQKCLRPWEEKCTATSTLHAYLTYQPMQCKEEPWQTWYKEGHIQFFKAPTDEELIKAYYGSKGINIVSLNKIDSDKVVCQACSVCPKSYAFSAAVASEDAAKMKQLGWKE